MFVQEIRKSILQVQPMCDRCISGIGVVRSTYGAALGFTLFKMYASRKSVGQTTGDYSSLFKHGMKFIVILVLYILYERANVALHISFNKT